jgi:MoxR-like ATPase
VTAQEARARTDAAVHNGPVVRSVVRRAQVRLLLLAALCGEHLLLLGPPGTAKSELVGCLAARSAPCAWRTVCAARVVPELTPGAALSPQGRRLSKLCKGVFFERLLTRFSVPEVRAHLAATPALRRGLLCRAYVSLRARGSAELLAGPAHAQELFGPLSLRALEQDLYVRQTKGYLPDASVAFIDEVR